MLVNRVWLSGRRCLRLLGAGVEPVVRVEGGLLRGRETGGVWAFLGVPYGAAPIGADALDNDDHLRSAGLTKDRAPTTHA
jgi:hypothetical protein